MNLDWYPPAPVEGPAAMLELAPDDWACEAKMDGCRVIIARPYINRPIVVWKRQGTPLPKGKGLGRLEDLFTARCIALWDRARFLEGEWVNREGVLYLFDLPDHPGTYDERHFALFKIVQAIAQPGICLIPRAESGFQAFYEAMRGQAEGVVMKRRASLYVRCNRPNTASRDWIKRRYSWDQERTVRP